MKEITLKNRVTKVCSLFPDIKKLYDWYKANNVKIAVPIEKKNFNVFIINWF